MGKRRREVESDSAMQFTAEYSTVFVDTSLDTHLAMLVSDSDTVLDFKRKLMEEHAKCFPNNGEIWIHSLKVKRKGNFYHLPDFMLVCNALHGVKGNLFLSADASGSLKCYINQKASECDRTDHCGVISSDANKILALTMSLPDGVMEENIVSGMTWGQKFEKYSGRTAQFWKTDSLENSLATRSPNKKCKKNYHEVVLSSPTLEDHGTQFHASGKETLQPVLAGCRIDAAEETPKILPDCVEETAEDEGVRYDPSNMECSGGVAGPSIVATVTGASKQKKISKRKKKLPHDQVIEMTLSSSDYCKEDKSFFSNTAVYAGNVNQSELSGIPEDECDNNTEAPCPVKGTKMKEPEKFHSALKVDNLNQFSEVKAKGKTSYSTNVIRIIDDKDKDADQPDIDDEQKVSSQNHDHVLLQSEKLGNLDQHEAHGNTMESVPADEYPGANEEMGCGSRSKTKAKKSKGKICYDAECELSENVMHLAPLTSPSLELNTLKHHKTARTDNALFTADIDLNVGNKNDRDLSANQQSDLNQCELDVSIKEANSSAKLMDADGELEDIKTIGNNSKKKRFQKAAAIFQDISDMELKTKKSGSTGLITRSSKSRKKDEKREFSIDHDLEVMLPSYNNTSASADPVITPKRGSPSRLLDSNNVEESEISGNSRKKKVKKFVDSNLGKSAVKQTGGKATNQPDLVEEHREVSLSHDHPVPIEFEKLGTSDWHEADGNIRESAQPNSSSCTVGEMAHSFKEKRMAKKSQGKILDETDGEHSDNGIHLTPIAAPNLDLKLLNNAETKRTYNILPTAETDMDVGTKQDGNLLVSDEIGMNQPEAGVVIIEPKLPSRLIHASGASDDTHNNHDKRKKKKTKKRAGKIQDTSYQLNEPQKAIDDDTLHHDLEVMPPSSSKASGCADPELKSNGAGVATKLLDVNMVEELKKSKVHRRKQSLKESANTAMDNLDMDPANNGTGGSSAVLLCSQTDHFPEESDEGENILFHKVKDVHMKMLDYSAAGSERKVGYATIKESDSMKLTQITKDVGVCEQGMEKKDYNSAGDCLTVPSVIENENQVNSLEPNQPQNNIEIVHVKDKKAKKKMKGHLAMSDCLENIRIKEQEVGVEEFSNMEKANDFLDFEQECQNVDSQVFSHKREKNLEIQFTATSTGNLVRHVEDKDEGVNFKHHFLSGLKQNKATCVDKVQKTIKSSEEMKTVKKVKKRGLPSASTSTELHNSAELSEDKDGEDKSHVRCSTGGKDGDFTVPLKVSDNGIIDSSPTEMCGMTTHKKHNESTVATPFTKDKNTPLDKSCLERSVRGNKRRQSGHDVSDKVVMKTTRKNSLFAKVGSLFQDCCGESSNDENRIANSDASTCSPSDSSSQSDCSEGESELSQASARNGSNDAQGRVTHEKNNAKLDLSAANEMTLDMILRSSKRFKKAKLIASQNELEGSQLEFVPDSQPINE